jgi:uncharacterized protein (DUF934 family)
MAILNITDAGIDVAERSTGQEISLAEWRDGVRPEAGRFELSIPNTEDIESLSEIVSRFDAVVLEFPQFQDGRAYSQARVLRERLNYRGEIRARGAVLCDQALFMVRSGFNALEIGAGDVDGFKRALGAYSAYYQPAADRAPPVRDLRAARRAAA